MPCLGEDGQGIYSPDAQQAGLWHREEQRCLRQESANSLGLPMLPATEPQRAGKELSEVDVEPIKPFFKGSLRSLIVLRTYSGSVLGDHSWQLSGD